MSEQEDETGLTPFEADLAALVPRVDGFQRERLIFEAGQAAARRDRGAGSFRFRRWAWPVAFSAMTAVAAALLTMLCIRPEPKVRIVAAPWNEPAADNVSGIPARRERAGTPDTLRDSAPEWLTLLLAGRRPIDYAPPLADRETSTTFSPLRAAFRRVDFDKRPPREPAIADKTALAQGPLDYQQLLNQLDGKQPKRPSAFYRPSPEE